MILEKVYDELYGMIEDLKKKIAASDVDITPALDSGTKIADYKCDGETGSLYAPTQVKADWNASEGLAEIENKPVLPTFESNMGGITLSYYENVSFSFPNDVTASLSAAPYIPEGHDILAVLPTSVGGAFSFGLSANKSLILAHYTASLNASFATNMLVISKPTNVGNEAEPTKKTTKKK